MHEEKNEQVARVGRERLPEGILTASQNEVVRRPYKERPIAQLRATLSMLCQYVWYKHLQPGEHLWSIPVDRERDFDCILSDAIRELEARRATWHPIETAPKDGTTVLLALNDYKIPSVDFGWHNGDYWRNYENDLLSPTHWMPLPDPPGASPGAPRTARVCLVCGGLPAGECSSGADYCEGTCEATELQRLQGLLNTPEIQDFAQAVRLEALHQRERWPVGHDAEKSDADWFWLIGYLAGKALHNPLHPEVSAHEKQLHRIITIAAAAANWHAAKLNQKHPGASPGASPAPFQEKP